MKSTPEELLKKIEYEQNLESRGKLKIFFGYAAGVGKTYAMLKAAHDLKDDGVDVVIGYVEPHTRPETMKLVEGLEMIDTAKIKYKDIILNEFDIDKAIKRNPEVILVDELAHTNAEGCRHKKRYQDIEELLKAGIDVYTTVNVQHIESLNDIVNSVTGIYVNERIPDRVFDNAHQIELIDIEPEELTKRLNAGKIYKTETANNALNNFFTTKNLIALRAIALRRTADRINKISEKIGIEESVSLTDEHILVCISSSPSNAKIIRTAARMAKAFNGKFTAIYVETSSSETMSFDDKLRLKSNLKLAEQLGARMEIVSGDDVPFQISEYAKLLHVSKVVVGRSNMKRKGHIMTKKSFTDKLIEYAPNLDIYIIPDSKNKDDYNDFKKANMQKKQMKWISFKDIQMISIISVISTIIGFLFYNHGLKEANIINVYILGVLIVSISTTGKHCGFIASIVSVISFNFFFIDPRFTLNAYDSDYPITFLTMFVSAFITGNLAAKIKQQAKLSSQSAYRTRILLETNQIIQQAKNPDEIIKSTIKQLIKLLHKTIVFYDVENGDLIEPKVYLYGEDDEANYKTSKEDAVARWVFKNNKRAGAGTSTLQAAKCQYLSVRSSEQVYGVIGISLIDDELETAENELVLSIIGECALALEKELFSKKKEEESMKAQKEELRANLLRSISHDLRTPLTSIMGNTSVLMNEYPVLTQDKKLQLYKDVYDDSIWLLNIVENILSVTRIEDDSMNINLEAEVIEEVIDEALSHVIRRSSEHQIIKQNIDELILAKMEPKLIVQVIINIIDNAIKYTPPGSKIVISAKKEADNAIIEIADNGNGISDENKERIFDMFYTSKNKSGDSRRGLGLGLALCKMIVNAHGGEISVRDNEKEGSGTVFSFTLKAQEVELYE